MCYLLVFAWLIERLGTTDWGRLFCLHDGQLCDVRLRACNELPAATLAAALMLWLVWLAPRDALRLALPAQLLPVAAYLFTQYLAVGTMAPTYAQAPWYEFAGSYWLNPARTDLADEHKLVYAANLLVGHTGILSMTPVLLLGWIGMARTAARGHGAGREGSSHRMLATLTVALTVMTFVFYVIRTESYGGKTSGPRWFFWLVPLWLLTMLPEADRWARHPRRRWLAGLPLAFSVCTASYALANPWQPSWLLTLFRRWGIVAC